MHSQLKISTQWKNEKTVLQDCFFTPPFKVANVTENKSETTLKLMLMSSSPGILDGDDYQIHVELAAKTKLHLSTQAFQRIFTMQNGAKQETNIILHQDSQLIYIAHPSVLHRKAKFNAQTTIHLVKKSILILGEILTSGRTAQDELFQFDYYNNIIDVYLEQKLIFRDNQRLCPAEQNLTSIGFYENFTHQAVLLIFGTELPLKIFLEQLNEHLKPYENIESATTLITQHGILVRILGTKAEQLFQILHKLADIIKNNSDNE